MQGSDFYAKILRKSLPRRLIYKFSEREMKSLCEDYLFYNKNRDSSDFRYLLRNLVYEADKKIMEGYNEEAEKIYLSVFIVCLLDRDFRFLKYVSMRLNELNLKEKYKITETKLNTIINKFEKEIYSAQNSKLKYS